MLRLVVNTQINFSFRNWDVWPTVNLKRIRYFSQPILLFPYPLRILLYPISKQHRSASWKQVWFTNQVVSLWSKVAFRKVHWLICLISTSCFPLESICSLGLSIESVSTTSAWFCSPANWVLLLQIQYLISNISALWVMWHRKNYFLNC